MRTLKELHRDDCLIHDFMNGEWVGIDILHEGAGFLSMGETQRRAECQSMCDKGNKVERFYGNKKRWEPRPNYPANYCFSYQDSWDKLMPVVSRIESMHLHVAIDTTSTWIQSVGVEDDTLQWLQLFPEGGFYEESHSSTKIQRTWNAIVAFIKWYNIQSSPYHLESLRP